MCNNIFDMKFTVCVTFDLHYASCFSLQVGAEGQTPEAMGQFMRYAIYCMPVVSFLFIQNFPTVRYMFRKERKQDH